MPPAHDAPPCRVPGCQRKAGPQKYLVRYRICHEHSTLPSLELPCESNNPVRWCQQCRKFHELDQFEGGRKSCRKALSQHNTRRTKRRRAATPPSSDTPQPSSGGTSSATQPASTSSTGSEGGSQGGHNRAAGGAPTAAQREPDFGEPVPTSFAEAFHAGAAAAAIQAGHVARSAGFQGSSRPDHQFQPYSAINHGGGGPSHPSTLCGTSGASAGADGAMEACSPLQASQAAPQEGGCKEGEQEWIEYEVDSPVLIEASACNADNAAAESQAAGLPLGGCPTLGTSSKDQR